MIMTQFKFQGSTITRTVISKNGEERRQAFRSTASNNNQRKSSIEKLEDIRVSRSSKSGFPIDMVHIIWYSEYYREFFTD